MNCNDGLIYKKIDDIRTFAIDSKYILSFLFYQEKLYIFVLDYRKKISKSSQNKYILIDELNQFVLDNYVNQNAND